MKQLISYSKRLYAKDALLLAVDAFRSDYRISFYSESDDIITIEFKAKNNIEEIIGEFNNYVICVENRRGMEL